MAGSTLMGGSGWFVFHLCPSQKFLPKSSASTFFEKLARKPQTEHMRLKASTKSSTKFQPSTSVRALMMSSEEHHRTQCCSQLFIKGSTHSSLIVPNSRFANSSLDNTKNAVGTEPWLTDKRP